MTAHADATARAELVVDVIGQAARHPRQQVVVTSPQPGDRRLEQVAEAVQLMPGLQVGVPGRLAGPPEAGVEVAIWFLGRGHSRHQSLVPPLEVSGVLPAEFPSHGLEQLIDLGVDELNAGVAAGDGAGRSAVEVAGPADALHPCLAVRQDRVRVQSLFLSPKTTGDLDFACP